MRRQSDKIEIQLPKTAHHPVGPASLWQPGSLWQPLTVGSDLLADERCSPVLDYLRSTLLGRTAPPVEENWDSEDEAEEAEVAGEEEQAE